MSFQKLSADAYTSCNPYSDASNFCMRKVDMIRELIDDVYIICKQIGKIFELKNTFTPFIFSKRARAQMTVSDFARNDSKCLLRGALRRG